MREVMKVRIKICGITRLQDALFCAEEGVDAVGFVFYNGSKRYISPQAARKISLKLPPFICKVGVFVNASPQEILETVKTAGIDCVQLHGEEGQDMVDGLRRVIKVIKAFRIFSDKDIMQALRVKVDAVLLDTYRKESFGGTGERFDWGLLKGKKFSPNKYIIVSGGITPYNIPELFAVCSPFAIDCSSGVEKEPGVKDIRKVKLLIKKVRSYESSR